MRHPAGRSWTFPGRVLALACAVVIGVALKPQPAIAAPPPTPRFELFAMDNGVGRGTWSPAQQANVLSEIGYAGISYNYTTISDLKTWRTELARCHLKFEGLYFPIRLRGAKPFPDGMEQAIELLRGTGAVLWVIIPQVEPAEQNAEEAVRRIRALADLAAPAGLRVVLYPHFKNYLATAEQALDLVLRIGRSNVSLTFNLCHELAAGNGSRVAEIIRRVAPCLSMVTLNGATDQPGPEWSNYIQRLGQGTFDVSWIVGVLKEVGYLGPIGIQFYGLKEEPRAMLEATFAAWPAVERGAD